MSKRYQPMKTEGTPCNYMFKPFLDLVVDPSNWKNPIDATIEVPKDAGDRKLFVEMISRAVTYFCGCVAEIDAVGEHKVRVRAAGYYMSVGA